LGLLVWREKAVTHDPDLIDEPVNARDYISEVVKKMLHTAD
jgi:hypothetical protein